MKRTLSLLLCLLLVAGIFAFSAAADSIDDFTFRMYIWDENDQLQPEDQTHSMADLPAYAGVSHTVKIYYKGEEITSGVVSETPGTFQVAYNSETGLWEMQMTGSPGSQIGIRLPTTGDGSILHSYTLQSIGGDKPAVGIVLRPMRWGDNGAYEDTGMNRTYANVKADVNMTEVAYFYYFDGTDYFPVTNITAENDAIQSRSFPDQNGKSYWSIQFLKSGSHDLIFSYGDGQTATVSATVQLPKVGLYKSRTPSDSNMLFQIQWLFLENKTVWILSEEGFTSDEADSIQILANQTALTADKTLRPGTTDRYDLSLTLPRPTDWSYNLQVLLGETVVLRAQVIDGNLNGSCMTVGDYTIGFSFTEGEDVVIINEGNWSNQYTTYLPKDSSQPYSIWRDITVSAGIKHTDTENNVYFDLISPEDVDLKITRMWIEEFDGDSGVFALDNQGSHTVTSGFDTFYLHENTNEPVPYGVGQMLYVKESYVGLVRIWAEISVSVNGNPVTGTASMLLESTRSTEINLDHKPDSSLTPAQRMADLNALLQSLADCVTIGANQQQTFQISLAEGEYEGTLVIPMEFDRRDDAELFLNGNQHEPTIFRGGIDLNESQLRLVSDVHFRAPDTAEEDKAVYNGNLSTVSGCSFVGYDVALDSSAAGHINPSSDNFFLNNEIAVRVDIEDLQSDMSRNTWEHNTFLNNTTAVRICSLNSFISPYYLRCSDSNFINNGTDFHADCGGSLYMYRNFYGEYSENHRPAYGKAGKDHKDLLKLDELLASKSENALKTNHVESCPAKLKLAPNTDAIETTVTTNPRWKFPIKNWWNRKSSLNQLVWGEDELQPIALALYDIDTAAEDPDAEYENILVADWELDTRILNDEADVLKLDASAFEEEGEKKIEVVDRDNNPLGTWTFDQEDSE